MTLPDILDGPLQPWIEVGVGAILALLIAFAAHVILYTLLPRLLRGHAMAHILIDRTREPARLMLMMFALQFVIAAAPADMRFAVAARNGAALLFIGAMTWLVMRGVAALGEAVVALHPVNVDDNLAARRVQTQARVLSRTVMFFVLLVGVASALTMFPSVRQIGTSLLASAGVAGLVAGFAARPVLSNLIAGLQIALTQPLRIDDVVIMDGEWGRIEEITSSYIVVKIWDQRRLVVPLQWVIENPFQNWTRHDAQLLGTVFLWLDFRIPLAPLRAELQRVCQTTEEWDRRVALLQVVDTNERAMQIRALVSAADASKAWDLRCRVREALIDYIQREHPDALPRLRAELDSAAKHPPSGSPAPPPARSGTGTSSAIDQPGHPKAPSPGDARVASG